MTSNLGSNEKRGIGFGGNTKVHKESAVIDFLTPEFRNRIDKILHFNTLTEDMIEPVVEKFLDELTSKLSNINIVLSIADDAKKYLTDMGFESSMGARSVKRTINNEFKKHLSKEILFGLLKGGGRVDIGIDENGFFYDYTASNISKDLLLESSVSSEYDFKTSQEAMMYAKNNPGTVIVRADSGVGYMVK